MPVWHDYAIYGVALRSSIALPLLVPSSPSRSHTSHVPGLKLRQVNSAAASHDTAACITLHTSTVQAPNGQPMVTLRTTGNATILTFASGIDFVVSDSGKAIFSTRHEATLDDVQIALLGVVLPFWLERHAVTVLHAAVVVIDGCAVGLMADSHAGKSTLAAALVAAGHPLLSDDLLVCHDANGAVMAQPGFPTMRMWPDTAAYFLGDHSKLERVRPGSDKRRAHLATATGRPGFGRFHEQPAPLTCIYAPQRGAERNLGLEISQRPPSQATAALIRHSVLSRALRASGESMAQLSRLVNLAARVPVRTVHYASGFEMLSDTCTRIHRDLMRIAAPSPILSRSAR